MTELIVALDLSTLDEVERMVARLGASVDFYKIGIELYSAEGPEVVRRVKAHGKRVFLDLKFHDIPRTVERAVKAGAALGVDMMTVHAAGGRAMITAAQEGARSVGPAFPRILAVTVLTSLDQNELSDMGIHRPMREQVAAMGALAMRAGADGIVCSPREVGEMRRLLGPAALLVTPGIRPAGADKGDQKRVATPAEAVRAGATHLVIGRPILEAAHPNVAAASILADIVQASG